MKIATACPPVDGIVTAIIEVLMPPINLENTLRKKLQSYWIDCWLVRKTFYEVIALPSKLAGPGNLGIFRILLDLFISLSQLLIDIYSFLNSKAFKLELPTINTFKKK